VELTGTNRITVNEVTTWSANEMGKPGCRSSREKNCPVRTLNQRAVGPASSSATTLLPGQTSPMPGTAATATGVSARVLRRLLGCRRPWRSCWSSWSCSCVARWRPRGPTLAPNDERRIVPDRIQSRLPSLTLVARALPKKRAEARVRGTLKDIEVGRRGDEQVHPLVQAYPPKTSTM